MKKLILVLVSSALFTIGGLIVLVTDQVAVVPFPEPVRTPIPQQAVIEPLPETEVKPIEAIEPIVVQQPVATTPSRTRTFVATSNTVLGMINDTRASLGLSRLSENGSLNASAAAKCRHMVVNDYFAHDAPDGTSWASFITAFGTKGEILGRQWGGATLEYQHQMWLNSSTHYGVIVGNYSHFGVAQCKYNNGHDLTVVHFGL